MNWKALIGNVFAQAPNIIQRVQQTHAQASNEEKRQAATDWLVFAAQVAQAVAPQYSGLTQAVAMAGGAVIDAAVAVSNGIGAPHKQPEQNAQPAA